MNFKKRCTCVDFVCFALMHHFSVIEKLQSEVSVWACGCWRSSVALWRAVGHNPRPHRQQRPFLSLFMPMSSLRTRSPISSSLQNWSAAHQKSLWPQNLSTAPNYDPPPLTMPSAARAPGLGSARTPAALASFPAWEETPAISRNQPTVTSSK